MKQKTKIIFIILCFLIIAVALLFIVFKDKKVILNIDLKKQNNVYYVENDDNLSILDLKYQNSVTTLINNKKNDKIYTVKAPLLIMNPYGTNITGLYIYFTTLKKYKIEYVIHTTDDVADYTNTLPSGFSHFHEGQIIGLIQGVQNEITIKLVNSNNDVESEYKYKINVPDFNTNSIKRIESDMEVDSSEIEDGLYMFSNISASSDDINIPLSFYDKYGILRAEFTEESGRHTNRVIYIDNKFLYAFDSYNFVLVNGLGKIENIYHTIDKNEHDYIYDESKNAILYVAGLDMVRILNLNDYSDELLFDLNDVMKDYSDKAKEYASIHNPSDTYDWAHINSIEIVNDNDLILSLRESSSIIYFENVYKSPKIKYIIAPKAIYENTEYEDYLLKQVGEFPVNAGQHSVYIEKDNSLKEGSYYLYFFNNNYAKSSTVVNEDWVNTIEGVGQRSNGASRSMYYKYLIDEDSRTFELVDSMDVPYSNAKSIVTKYHNNYIVALGKRSSIYEYDENKKLLLKLRMNVYKDIYRGFKLDMNHFWFDTSRYTKQENKNYDTISEEDNESIFNYNKKTGTILGVNSNNSSINESNIIYYDTLYFTIYDYSDDTIVIPSSINNVKIKSIAGINLNNVKKIIIEEGIEKIDNYAFLGCDNLEEIILPSTLKSIGSYAFLNLKKIKNIYIPDSIDYIGEYAFKGFDDTETISLPKNRNYAANWKTNMKAKIEWRD